MSVFQSNDTTRIKALEVKVDKIEKKLNEICSLIGQPSTVEHEETDDDYCSIS